MEIPELVGFFQKYLPRCTFSPSGSFHTLSHFYLFYFSEPVYNRGSSLLLVCSFSWSGSRFFPLFASPEHPTCIITKDKTPSCSWDTAYLEATQLSCFKQPFSFLDYILMSCWCWSGGEGGAGTKRAMECE